MAVILVDTDILIDVSRSIEHAINFVSDLERNSELAISSVTQMELLVGCRNKAELNFLEKFLLPYRIFHITEPISVRGINLLTQYNLSHGLLIADALIAATAITLNFPFISQNQRDFRFISGLDLLPYP